MRGWLRTGLTYTCIIVGAALLMHALGFRASGMIGGGLFTAGLAALTREARY